MITWEIALPGKVLSTPIERNKNEMILICEDRRLYSINTSDGSIRWKIKPGGKLRELILSPDGSIITRDDNSIYSIFGSGNIRWSIDVTGTIISNLTVNERGDILFIAGNKLKLINRFGEETVLIDEYRKTEITTAKNCLIVSTDNHSINAHTLGGKLAWEFELGSSPVSMMTNKDKIILAYSSGDVDSISNEGQFVKKWTTDNTNPYQISVNYLGDVLIYGDKGITRIGENSISLLGIEEDFGLYYSNGLLIKTYKDWSIKGIKTENNSIFYTSGKKQVLEKVISLSDKKVWGDAVKKDFYTTNVLSNNRDIQRRILNDLSQYVNKKDLLDVYPNFYSILLLASSGRNRNSDIRKEAYKIIGSSRDISFLPYLLSDLEGEDSYHIIPYIYYALGQLAVDRSGEVVELINLRLDDYHDENLVLNGIYSLYNINKYSDGEYLEYVFQGIETTLNGGYSKTIEKICYDIINKLK